MKLLYTGLVVMTTGAICLLFSVIMEVSTGEPVFIVMMKVAAGLFGVGGPLVGVAVARRRRKKEEDRG